MTTTRENIMDVAERLFAENGIGATSLRAIMEAAGVNAAAIAYHFGAKEDLIGEILKRRLAPLNQQRLKMLDDLEAGAGKRSIPVEAILHAFIAPALRLTSNNGSSGGVYFIRFLGRLYGDAGRGSQKLLQEHFGELLKRFFLALKRSVPGVAEKTFTWKFYFMVGALAYTMVDRSLIEAMSKGRYSPDDTETAIRELVTFTVAGLEGSRSLARRSKNRKSKGEHPDRIS
jgi:AcrR family transcriptional regulator